MIEEGVVVGGPQLRRSIDGVMVEEGMVIGRGIS